MLWPIEEIEKYEERNRKGTAKRWQQRRPQSVDCVFEQGDGPNNDGANKTEKMKSAPKYTHEFFAIVELLIKRRQFFYSDSFGLQLFKLVLMSSYGTRTNSDTL